MIEILAPTNGFHGTDKKTKLWDTQHENGKSLFSMGKSTLNGHFQYQTVYRRVSNAYFAREIHQRGGITDVTTGTQYPIISICFKLICPCKSGQPLAAWSMILGDINTHPIILTIFLCALSYLFIS